MLPLNMPNTASASAALHRADGYTAHDGKRYEGYLLNYPLKRWAQPEEIGQMVLFYQSPAAKSITGNIILADGGATLLANRAELYGL